MRVHRSENEIQGHLHATHPLLVLPRKPYIKILSPLSTTRSWKREHPGCNSTTQENPYCGIFVVPRWKRWLAFSSCMVNYSSNWESTLPWRLSASVSCLISLEYEWTNQDQLLCKKCFQCQTKKARKFKAKHKERRKEELNKCRDQMEN